MTESSPRPYGRGLYVTFAGASLVVLVLTALLAWPRASSLSRQGNRAFETDEPPAAPPP